MQKTNVKREIYIEKTNFISNNSSFFHANIDNVILISTLKSILLNPAPLKECEGYEDLIEEIKTQRVKYERENIYSYTMETIFKVVYIIRRQMSSPERIEQQTEQLRQYVRYVSEKNTGKMYYSDQKVIKISDGEITKLKEEQKSKGQKRRA